MRAVWHAGIAASLIWSSAVTAQESSRDSSASRARGGGVAQDAPAAQGRDSLMLRGILLDMDALPRGGIAISLDAHGPTGELQWREIAVTSSEGEYSFTYLGSRAAWPSSFRLSVDRQRMVTDSMRFLWMDKLPKINLHKWSRPVRIDWTSERFSRVATSSFALKLQYDPAPPLYTFLLFSPALIGLLAAAWTGFMLDEGTKKDVKEASRRTSFNYALAGTVAWVGVITWFAIGFARADLRAINLFSESLSIPVLVPVAAFLGVLVYATDGLLKLANRDEPVNRGNVQLELGNRVFIAPYVAVVAVLVLFTDRSTAPAALVAFGTGLWIEPVLETVRAIGTRLLSAGVPGVDRSNRDARVTANGGASANGGATPGARPAAEKVDQGNPVTG